ncbi:LysE family translocator [Halobacteriales archaeon SW_12_67_38]|jgi:threonine/homoserine/homoserine lactone efflux protein|nr:MAG: LysE family translocator [Halobacteriales archaeon QH_9_66_26]PSQ52070.1 MAG: LysE family translocator [Halobacteriales archaeon SW_12_67_38]
MISIETVSVFVPASLALILAPGPDTFYVLSRALGAGRRAGVHSACGISAGVLVHTLAAVVGLSAVLRESALAFRLVKYVGAAYLVFLGVQTLRSSQGSLLDELDEPRSADHATADRGGFTRGLLVNVLNPKVALFFLAFLPAFVPATAPNASLQLLALGCLYAGLTVLYLAGVAVLSGTIRAALRSRTGINDWLRYGTGGALVGFGIVLAVKRDVPS